MSPLSQSQLGIFYACQDLGEKDGNYQVPVLYELPESIDLSRLKSALEMVIKAHPYILSRIVLQDDTLMMEPQDFSEDIVTVKSVASIDYVRPTFCRTMDLMHERLFRMEIYKTPKGSWLYIDFHHIIIDGSSWGGVLMPEINRAYNEGKVAGEIIDGAQIANDELRLRQSDEWKAQQEWYLKEFGDAAELDSMPVPSNMEVTDRGLVETNFQIPVRMAVMQGICEKYGVKEGVVFQAAWGKLLADFTAEEKAFFCSIYSGRGDKAVRQTMTMMVHTMPVFMQMPSSKGIGEWLNEVAEQQSMTRQKNAYSFSDIHTDLNLRSDILFAYHGKVVPTDVFDLSLNGEAVIGKDLRIARPGITLDGQLLCTPTSNSVETRHASSPDYTLRISYQSSLYSPEMIAEMAESYAAIVNSMAEAEKIGDLECVSERQVEWLNEKNPEKPMEYPKDKRVIDLFNENVLKYPDNECCVFEGTRLTYRQVGEVTDRLAGMIQQRINHRDGSLIRKSENRPNDPLIRKSENRPNDPPVISFIVPRNELMLIVPVAIVKAGCTYQPLDSSYPKERLNFMIKDAEAQLLICTEEFRELVNEYEGETLIVNGLGDIARVTGTGSIDPSLFSRVNVPVPETLDDTFILLYTSGTTGTPKGVMLTQRNILNFVLLHTKNLDIDNTSRMTAYASYGFDAYMMDLWAAMTSGAALHIISEEIRYDLVALRDYIEREKITHAFMTTQVGTQMAVDFPDIPTLKVLMTGGEKLVSIDPPKYRLINAYGPTECTVYVTWHEVTRNDKNIPIGEATSPARLYVVNKDFKRVPMGAIGELLVSGAQTGKGYLKQPEKTAAAFIDNPFCMSQEDDACVVSTGGCAQDFAKAYRTGDIVRYREDGLIEFIGRKDGQVKIRGFRIELKEVEAVIRDFPGIKNVTVQAFDLEAGGKAIAAYIVADEKIDTQALNTFIMDQKPPYMVPAVTMQIEEIPLNVNGKVDKKRLPKPEVTVDNNADVDVPAAPLNRLEEELMQMVCALANCKQFAITTPLQYVGLTSITTIKLSAQLFKRFNINIPNKELRNATLQSIENTILDTILASKTDALNQCSCSVETGLAPSSDDIRPLSSPLSNAQLGVYYECLKNPLSTVYNVPYIIKFPESVTEEQLKRAVEKAIVAHPALMAHFVETTHASSSDGPVMVISKGDEAGLVSTGGCVEELRKTYVQPFDLAKGPLYRATVVENTLLFDVHHLIMDGSSVSIFIHDICNNLEGKEITSETYTFLDYARDEQAADQSEAEQFFTEQLSTIDDATSLPADIHGNEQEGKPATAYQPVNHSAVEKYANAHGITPASVYLAAVQYLAARYGNTKDVCICTVSSGRSNIQITDTVGMFVNTLALVSHLTDCSVEDYINNVAANFTTTLDHENYPFAKIAEKFNLNAELVFVYQLGVVDELKVNGQEVTMDQMELSAPKFKVTILIEEHDGKVCLVSEYNDALYSADMMRRMLESLNQVIENMLNNPQEQITKVSIISPSQQEEVSKMNFIGSAPLPIRLFHKGMERWANETPDRMAVIATDKSLTYAEFNKSANRIANALINKGVRKGDAVVVLLPRRSSTISCIFGIMKAGGAYIPCDPEYPTERIQLIAEDSGAPFVVTTADLVGNYGERGLLIDDLVDFDNDNDPNVDVQPTDLAYYIYTSGSTG